MNVQTNPTDTTNETAPTQDDSSSTQAVQNDESTNDADDGQDGDSSTKAGNEGEASDKTKSPEQKTLSKLERRIARQSRALGGRDQELAQLRAENERLKAGKPGSNDDDAEGEGVQREQVLTLAQRIAADQIERRDIAARTETMLAKGKALDPKFQEKVLEVSEEIPFVVGPQGQERASPFIKAVYLQDHPAEILLHLAENPDELAALADMSHEKRLRQLTKLDLSFESAPTRRSNAAKPLSVINGGKSGAKSEDQMTDAEWRAQRNKQRQTK